MHAKSLHFLIFLLSLNTILINPTNSSSSLEKFIYAGCSPLKYNNPSESNLDSLFASVVNSASLSNFNKFKISLPQNTTVYGLYQCRGDLSIPDCHDCVSNAVSQLGTMCNGASGGVLQFEGCLVRYDNVSFLGVEDKSVMLDKCGPSIEYDVDLFTGRDAVLDDLTAVGGEFYRASGPGKVQGIVQCVQDLSAGECDDCLKEAIRRLKSECGGSAWGDMFFSKCYARYSERGYTSQRGNDEDDDEIEKTLAILIGVAAAVTVLIVFLSFFSKLIDRKGGK